jgi:hypothetical protein
MKPIFIEQFYHDGRGPELQKVHYKSNGRVIVGTDYYLAYQPYTPENLRHVKFIKPQAFMLTPEELRTTNPYSTLGKVIKDLH